MPTTITHNHFFPFLRELNQEAFISRISKDVIYTLGYLPLPERKRILVLYHIILIYQILGADISSSPDLTDSTPINET
jgi:hypothetical protein